ncbi:hypothetical protein LCGC14_1649740 [marine sediment metagenome]|uniref:Uncharacterized protein n=1 Tax=marine sediment metagenome TaxID=412755 RepID=A0A0F9HY37_9ZZZZ
MSEIPIYSFPDYILILSASNVRLAAAQIANELLNGRIKNVTVETADWAGPVTDYDNAAAYNNANAFKVDVIHGMNSDMAHPIAYKGPDNFIRRVLLDPQTVDLDTTTVWILAEQAPPYDVQLLFVG